MLCMGIPTDKVRACASIFENYGQVCGCACGVNCFKVSFYGNVGSSTIL